VLYFQLNALKTSIGQLLSLNIQGAFKLTEDFANHIFTNTEQKYMMLLPFERGMFAVS